MTCHGFGKGAKYIWKIEEVPPMDSTQNVMHSHGSHGSPHVESMESMESMRQEPESMTKASCYEHGTNYRIPTCKTCLELAKETA